VNAARSHGELAAAVRGPVLLPGSDGYAQETAGFNLTVTHRPEVVVGATEVADVRAAVRYARSAGLKVGVLATGHGGTSSHRGLLVSTRRMTGIDVDTASQSVRVGAGVRWGEVIDALSGAGLAPLNGSSPLVGVVGYTLGGGLGPLGRLHGYASDHVLEMQVVTPDGIVRTVSPLRHPELYSGILGGKDSFGIVTAMRFRVFPHPRFFGGGLYFSADHAHAVLAGWSRWAARTPDEISTSIALLRLPDVPSLPDHLRGRPAVHLRAAHFGSRAAGEAMARELRQLAPSTLDSLAERPYSEIALVHDDGTVPLPYLESNIMLRTFDVGAAEALLRISGPASTRTEIMVEVRQLGGALNRPPAYPSLVGNRDAAFVLSTLSRPESSGSDDLFRDLAPWATGARYLNFLGGAGADARLSSAYAAADLERLRCLKSAHDPDRLFPAHLAAVADSRREPGRA
jgi:FAD/FMN-containing dehydrogenase